MLVRLGWSYLVGDTPECLFTAQNLKHIKDSGRCRPPCQRGPQRLGHFSELTISRLCKLSYAIFENLWRPCFHIFEFGQEACERLDPNVVELLLRLIVQF